jgi:hypothetical protein
MKAEHMLPIIIKMISLVLANRNSSKNDIYLISVSVSAFGTELGSRLF